MRKGLAVSAVLASLIVAGCGASGESTPPAGSPAPPETETSAAQPPRTAPAKSLELADPCAIVTETQAKELGADQPPRPLEQDGVSGCDYDLGESGAGFMVFVAANKAETMQEFAEARTSKAEMTDLGGYPAAQVGDETNCLLSVDVSDQGSLFLNTLVDSGNPNPCDLSKRFAEAALQNLPNG